MAPDTVFVLTVEYISFLDTDAVLSIPGSGNYIEQKLNMNSRLNQGIINLVQMKSILQYMLDMAESIEQELAGLL